MKKIIVLLATVLVLLMGVLAGCGGSSDNASTNDNQQAEAPVVEDEQESQEEPVAEEPAAGTSNNYSSYQDILDDYSQRLKDATPRLIEEYNTEAANNTEGLEGLAELSNGKVEELAVISNDGVATMASFMMGNGSGEYSEYEEWAQKLYDVYEEEAQKIYDVYMDSAL